MKTLFIGNLARGTTETGLETLFSEFGKVRSVKLVKDIFSGDCKGFGFVEMEGHEARNAISGLDGKIIDGKTLQVRHEKPGGKGRKSARR
ncbi:MAG: RNA-binding protein [Gammaproteobacteria bacterium]|nr:RNA-binding protein [Gammaproteobacteria bacterium]